MTEPVSRHFNENAENQPKSVHERPKHPPPFSVRLSAQQRSRLEKEAKGQPLGRYVRSLIFEDDGQLSARKCRRVDDAQSLASALALLGQSRISQNLNQLARAANSGSLPITPEMCQELTKACAEVQEIRTLVVRALGLRKS